MSVVLECPSRKHKVRLATDRFWQNAICPICKVNIDPTRIRRTIKWLVLLLSPKHKGTPVTDEVRYGPLRRQIERLAREAWISSETLKDQEFTFNPSRTAGSGPEKIMQEILNHARRVAPGLSIPYHIPKVRTGSLIDAGQFSEDLGYVSIKLANGFIMDFRAIRAVLAHEACHYILENSGIREKDQEQNERLTDACMFVCGLGKLFLEGYRKEASQAEFADGHRLGYLTDKEYVFAERYVQKMRSNNLLQLPDATEALTNKLASRMGSKQACERLIKDAQKRHPGMSDSEIIRLVIEELERDRR